MQENGTPAKAQVMKPPIFGKAVFLYYFLGGIMEIKIDVSGQTMILQNCQKYIAPSSNNFIKFAFILSPDWDGLNISAHFIQNGKIYKQDLDVQNKCILPSEITTGAFEVTLYGKNDKKRIGTSKCVDFVVLDDLYIDT